MCVYVQKTAKKDISASLKLHYQADSFKWSIFQYSDT